jgi:hypothetical protein
MLTQEPSAVPLSPSGGAKGAPTFGRIVGAALISGYPSELAIDHELERIYRCFFGGSCTSVLKTGNSCPLLGEGAVHVCNPCSVTGRYDRSDRQCAVKGPLRSYSSFSCPWSLCQQQNYRDRKRHSDEAEILPSKDGRIK